MSATELLRTAVARLESDGFIAYPTETVWGLGACSDRPEGISRLIAWKGRASDAPMSLLVSSVEAALGLGCVFDEHAKRLARAFWPGPLTLVVPCQRRFASGTQRIDRALGLRCSPHPVAQALTIAVDRAGLSPLTSTSLNRTGEVPAADGVAARALISTGAETDLAEPLLVFDPEHDAGGERPSSVVDCTGGTPRILRSGAIDSARLERTWSQTQGPETRERIR